MEIAIALLGLGLGACIGIMAADMRQRHDVILDIEKGAEEAKKLVVGLQETHNNLVTQIKGIGDRLGAVEFSVRSSAMTQKVFK